jgi:hypothetical protein
MKSFFAVLMAMVLSVGAFAATEAEKEGRFDSHIDSWVRGSIMSLDADSGKFTVRGVKMPYATAYASMQKEIAEKTANLDQGKREEKAAEIRKDWQDRLAKAKTERPGNEGDFSFAIPAKGTLSVMSGHDVRNMAWLHEGEGAAAGEKSEKGEERPIATAAGDQPKADEKEARAMMSMKDLKIGDKVMVGYDDGVITNEAWTVVKGGMGMHKAEGKADVKAHEVTK